MAKRRGQDTHVRELEKEQRNQCAGAAESLRKRNDQWLGHKPFDDQTYQCRVFKTVAGEGTEKERR